MQFSNKEFEIRIITIQNCLILNKISNYLSYSLSFRLKMMLLQKNYYLKWLMSLETFFLSDFPQGTINKYFIKFYIIRKKFQLNRQIII